jgi:hypothetical protein
MNDWFIILITSGIVGILITSLINLFIAFKMIRSQRGTTQFKAHVDFLKEKSDLLRNLRSTVIGFSSSQTLLDLDLLKILKDHNTAEALIRLKDERGKFDKKVAAYKEIRYCFAKHQREKLDELLKEIRFTDSLFSPFFTFGPGKSSSLSEERQMEIGLKLGERLVKLMSEFEEYLIQSIDDELISAADRLSNFG